MSTYHPFINEEYLKGVMPVDVNVEWKLIRTGLRDAQEMYIRDLIGSGLYDAICDAIENGTAGAISDPDLLELVDDYIAPALARFVIYEMADVATFQMTNKGYQNRNSEWSNPTNINEITGMALRAKQRADHYAHKVTAFLLENQTRYPLYRNPGSSIDTVYPRESPLIGGIYFGDTVQSDCFNNKNPNPNP